MVLDEIDNCHPLVPGADELIVAQMRRLGLSHLITASSVQMPLHGEADLSDRGKRLATANSVEEAEDSVDEDTTDKPPVPHSVVRHGKLSEWAVGVC